ncbi:VCBS repeat-containing protein [Streptomyces qinzhouensis]|uniref:VCBS repeat-containing protein n=1 Tax=Streptomyces qinzhouensis TaxID=2599401 RepID=UPI001FE704FB|nr:VCBS repeat-containing protein [Streptomyces qinzhouensis]
MERPRITRGLPRRTTAGVAAVLAAALGVTLLMPDGDDGSGSPPERKPAKADTARSGGEPLDEKAAREKAMRTGKPVEVVALRDATSTTHALPSGKFRLSTQAAPVRAQVDGEWLPIDTTLKKTDDGWRPKATVNPVTFHSGKTMKKKGERSSRGYARIPLAKSPDSKYTDLATFTAEGRELTVGWPGELPEPEVSGASALYKNVLDGVDLLLTARDTGFTHVLVVHNAQAAANPALAKISYQLSSPDLSFSLNDKNDVLTVKDPQGVEVGGSPSPFMWDSSGKPAVTQGEPAQDAAAKAGGTFALTGLLGPQIGTKRAPADASLTGGGTGTAVLSVAPDQGLLTGKETVYPVFIDPPLYGKTAAWTTAYERYPTTSFWDGANFNSGTTEGRVGYESTTGGLSRSFYRLTWKSSIKGATISDALFTFRQTYSWSCTASEMEVHQTDDISTATTWREQPTTRTHIGTKNFAHGWNSSCPDAYVTYDGKSIAQTVAANAGETKLTIRMKAKSETSANSWKKFVAEGASAPKLDIEYTRPPKEPTGLTVNGRACDTTSPYTTYGKGNLTFAATSSDPDGDLKSLHFQIWRSDAPTPKIFDNIVPAPSGPGSKNIDKSNFVNGKTYYWQVKAVDGAGTSSTYAPPGTGTCRFVYDDTAPASPDVTSADFPEDDGNGGKWSVKPFGTAGKFIIKPAASGGTGTDKFYWSFNRESFVAERSATVAQGAAGITLSPPNAGPNILYVKAADAAGNMSLTSTRYTHYVTPRDKADAPGDVTGDGTPDLYVIDATGDLRLYPAEPNGDLHSSLAAAHDDGKAIELDADDDGKPDYGYHWVDANGNNPALITHNGDFTGGDGVQDLVARMPDGKLYIYRGDGYGSLDVSKRVEVHMPSNAPPTSSLTQILAVGDITNDKLPEVFATAGDALWVFTGYTGAAFDTAIQLSATAWTNRDLVSLGDHDNDGAADMVWRDFNTNRLLLRHGKPATGGAGTDLLSLASAVASKNGIDAQYGTNWTTAVIPLMTGTPDVNKDGIPEIWAVTGAADVGIVRFYPGGATAHGAPVGVISSDWRTKKALG